MTINNSTIDIVIVLFVYVAIGMGKQPCELTNGYEDSGPD